MKMAEQADVAGNHHAAELFRWLAKSRACQAEGHLTRLEPGEDAINANDIRSGIRRGLTHDRQ
jgi:hypothetical protein